jgi:hypothetical protein
LTTKRAPDLQFALDASIERGERIMQLIREVEREADTSAGPETSLPEHIPEGL